MALGVIKKLSEAKPMIQSAFSIHEFTPKEGETWDRAYARYRVVVK